ncbi:MAG: dockerin type I domain-containing protein [Bacteroidales bacterium]|nr:dockerin type I domain-containing protein [Bacteroidales bacterium]
MLSLVAMTSAPMAAFADADISSQVGQEVGDWTKSGEDLKLEGDIFISTDGSDISQAIGTLVPGKYLLSAATLENAKLYVNGSELVEGAFELAQEQQVTITVKAVEAGKQFKVGGFNLKLDFDFKAEYDMLNLKLSNAVNQLDAYSTDFWEQELLDEYQNVLAVDIAKVKDDSDDSKDSYNIYKEYKLYLSPSEIERRIATFAENVTAALANKEANAYATAELAKVQTAWDELKAALDDKETCETAKEIYGPVVEAIKIDLDKEIDAVKAAYEGKTAAADYAKATVDVHCKDLNDHIVEAKNGISIANGNSEAYSEVKDLVESTKQLYDAKVQELVNFIVADEAQNSYESLLQLAQTKLSAEYAKVMEADAANKIENAADNKDANMALVKKASENIQDLTDTYKTRYNSYKDAYGDVKITLEDVVSNIEKGLNAIQNTEYDADIQAIQEKIQAVKSSFATAMAADEEVPDYSGAKAEIQNMIAELQSATNATLANYYAHQATMEVLEAVLTKLDDANKAVNALKSEKGEYAAEGRWITTPEEVLKAINGYSEAAEEAYKKGEAASYSFDAAQVEKDIEAYVQAAEAAVGDFERVAGAIDEWEKGLAAIKAYIAEEDYSVTDADGKTTYGTKIGNIQKAIDGLKADLEKALALKDIEHASALRDIVPSKPAELTSIDQETFEEDKANYQGNINLNAVVLQRTLLVNRIESAQSALNDDMENKYNEEALGNSSDTQINLFLAIKTDLSELFGKVPAKENITKDTAAAMRVTLNELNADMDKIMSNLDKLKADADVIVAKVNANNAKYNELDKVISGLKTQSEEVKSKNQDTNRAKEFEGYYNAIQTSITTLEGQITTSKNNETLVADYTGTEETPGYQKTIENIQAEIAAKVELVIASNANWEAWDAQAEAFGKANFLDAENGLIVKAKAEINAIATPVNAGQTYFLGLVDKYEKQAKELRDSIEAKYGERKSVEYTNTVKSTIKTLQENIAKAETDAKNNEVAHNLQVEAQVDAQAEWTSVYDRLSAEDKSTQIQTWLDKLTEIQLAINELNETVKSNFETGHCYGSNAEEKYTQYKASIISIKTQWEDPEGYDKFLAQDNLDRYNRFNDAIAETKKAFDKAVTSLDKFLNIVDKELEVDFEDVLDANKKIYEYNQKIRDLKAKVNEAYTTACATSKGVYDLEESNKKQADAYTAKIDTIYKDCIAELNAKSKTLLEEALSAANDSLVHYEGMIVSYKESVREAAFSDVKGIIAKAELYKTDPELAVRLAEGFLKTLRGAGELLPAGLEAAAQAQYDALVAELYAEIKANRAELQGYIDNKVLAASYLEKYNEAVAEYVEKAETGLKAVGSAAKEAKNMYELGLAKVEKLIVDFKAKDCYTSAKAEADKNSESLKAYEALQVTFSEVKAELVKLQEYASGYVAVNVQIANIQQKLKTLISRVEDAKLLGTVHTIMGSVDVDDDETVLTICKKLKIEISEQYAVCDSKESAAMVTQISTLYREYNLAVTATEEDIKSYELKIAEYEAELTRISKLTEEDEESKREAYMALEKNIGVTRTELTNIYDAAYVTNLQTGFSEQLEAISQTQQSQTEALASYNKNVQVAYAEALASIQTKQVALSQKMESYSSESMLLVYSDNITGEIASLNKELEVLIGNIDKMQLPFKINDEIKLTLDTKIQTLETTYEELHAKLEGYKYVNIEEFTAAAQTNVIEKINAEKAWIKKAYESEKVGEMLTEESKSKYEANEAKITSYMKEVDKQYSYSETTGRIGEVTKSMEQTKENLANMQLEEDVKKDYKAQMEEIEKALNALEKYNSDSYRGLITEDIDGGKLLDEEKNELENKEIDFVAEAVDAIFNKVGELKKQLAELEQNALNSSYMLGDVNRDKEVTVADYMEILNVALEQSEFESGSLQFLAADINRDGEINIGDITAVVKIINGTYDPSQARSYARCMPNNSADRLSLTAEGNGVKQRIAVNLDATLAYTGCQMDIMLPAGVTFVGAEVANRANGFSLNSNELSNGRLRVVLSSLDEADFAHGDGALFYLDVEVSHNYAGNGVGVENILFTDNAVHVYALPAVSGEETTGIGMVSVGEEVKEKIYSVSGKLMNGLKRGVNIIRGNDGTSKKVLVK